jgi:hypothetical protein
MQSQRVTRLVHEDGLYRYLVGPEEQEVLFDYLAADHIATAWERKARARSADLDSIATAVETWLARRPGAQSTQPRTFRMMDQRGGWVLLTSPSIQ